MGLYTHIYLSYGVVLKCGMIKNSKKLMQSVEPDEKGHPGDFEEMIQKIIQNLLGDETYRELFIDLTNEPCEDDDDKTIFVGYCHKDVIETKSGYNTRGFEPFDLEKLTSFKEKKEIQLKEVLGKIVEKENLDQIGNPSVGVHYMID